MKTIVLIGDVIGSRQITNRAHFQQQLQKSLARRNSHLKDRYISPMTITLGDEFQAVYADGESVFADIIQVSLDIWPQRLRCAAGIGEIVTPLNRQQAIGMDGPAFHLARAGIEQEKQDNFYLAVAGLPHDIQPLVNSVLELISRQLNRWNQNRLTILNGLMQNKTVQQIAAELGISDKSVYKTMDTSQARSIFRTLQDVTRLMNQTARES